MIVAYFLKEIFISSLLQQRRQAHVAQRISV